MKGSFVTSFEAAGGNAQKFFMDIRLCMQVDEKLKKTVDTLEGKKSVPYGANVKVWAEKNRHNRPYIEGVMTVLFGKGVSNIMAYQRFLTKDGALRMKGAGFYELEIPGLGIIKARGPAGASDAIKTNMAAVKSYIDEKGGFLFVAEEDEG